MTMKDYPTIRTELKAERENIRYFNKGFFATYLAALDAGKRYDESGIDDSYNDGGIWTFHRYDDVRESDFYTKNGSAYCVFLGIMYRHRKMEVMAD